MSLLVSSVRRPAPPTTPVSTVTLQRGEGHGARGTPAWSRGVTRLPGKRMVGQRSSGRDSELEVLVVWGSSLEKPQASIVL